jgi:hypothetical protein
MWKKAKLAAKLLVVFYVSVGLLFTGCAKTESGPTARQ